MKLGKYLKRYTENTNNQLIGVQFQSDWLPIMLRYQTEIDVRGDNVVLTASPNVDQEVPLDNFVQTLSNEGYGELLAKRLVSTKEAGPATNDIQKGDAFNRANLYKFRIFIGAKDTVTQKIIKPFTVTTGNGSSAKFTLIEVNVINTTFTGCLRILLKDKDSNGLTFFTNLLDSPLSRLNAKKLLDIFTHKNVTGLGLMGARVNTGKVSMGLYPMNSDISLQLWDNNSYQIRTDTGTFSFKYDDINQAIIKKVGLRSYIFTLEIGKTNIELLFGI